MPYPKLIGLLAVAGLLAGCMSSRIAAHEDTWQKLSKQDQQRLGSGDLRAGDTEEMVRIALGAPDEVLQITHPGGQQTVWLYDLTVLHDTGNYLHLNLSSPGFEKEPNGERRITFQDGVMVNEMETGMVGMDRGDVNPEAEPANLDEAVRRRIGQRFQARGIPEFILPGLAQTGVNWEAELANLDEAVGLTPEQRVKAREILEKKAAALNAISPAERLEQGRSFRQAAAVQISALLTPEQRQKRNEHFRAAHGSEIIQERAQESAERTFVADFVRSSKSIAARLGAVTSLSLQNGSSIRNNDVRRGHYTYAVLGDKNSEALKIYWEKTPASAPMKIVKVEAADGTVIPL